nr:DUF4406 domain-containing protein [uncultured Carboxylicivirga sp.]
MSWRVYIIGRVGNGSVNLTDEVYKSAFDKFQRIERKLLNAGFEVRNPMKYVPRNIPSWHAAMDICLPILCQCNAVYLIEDFKNSKGGRLEYYLANELNKRLITDEVVEEMVRNSKEKLLLTVNK